MSTPLGCARCEELAAQYLSFNERVAKMIARQRLCAMRHQFGDLMVLDAEVALSLEGRKTIMSQITEHWTEHSALPKEHPYKK
jgi:hypothetical protein